MSISFEQTGHGSHPKHSVQRSTLCGRRENLQGVWLSECQHICPGSALDTVLPGMPGDERAIFCSCWQSVLQMSLRKR